MNVLTVLFTKYQVMNDMPSVLEDIRQSLQQTGS